MRFTENGPRIPNELLDARDAGDVVFVCGAGISIPAGLPDFFDLTARVAHRIGVEPDSDIGRAIRDQRKRRSSGTQSSTRDSLSFDRIFSFLVREFGVSQVENEVIAVLSTARRPRLDHHRALLDLARGPDGRVRLVTTNFDRLFERANPHLHPYLQPNFPDLLRQDGFDGLVHLHGILPKSSVTFSGNPLGLILSAADFGRAYLADAWATRFICNLLDRHIVVLLGYSADDPPVRYLLEGLNLAGRIREQRLFSFIADDDAQVAAEWRERGVTAIPYSPVDKHRHLWETVHCWADRARDPAAWQNRIVALAAFPPRQLKPFERGQVAALCSSTEGATVFANAKPPLPAEWLCVFDAACRYWKPGRTLKYDGTQAPEIDPLTFFGLDDDPPRPEQRSRDQAPPGIDLLEPLKSDDPIAREIGIVTGWRRPVQPMNARLFQLSRWVLSVMASPAAVWWAASKGNLHPNLHLQLALALDRNDLDIEPVIRRAWRLVLEARDSVPDDMRDGWWGIQAQVQKDGWTAATIREFSTATRPRLTAKRSWTHAPLPPEEAAPSLARIAEFDVNYPKLMEDTIAVPDDRIAAVMEVVRSNLKLGASLEEDISKYTGRLPTLYPEDKPGEHYHDDCEAYYLTFAQLFRRLASFDTDAARREYQHWDNAARFFVPLRMYALADPKITTASEAGRALRALDLDTFWDGDHARELLWAIRARWPSILQRDRLALEAKNLQGREKFEAENEQEYLERRATLSAERLIWMRDAGLNLSRPTTARLPKLKQMNPRWRDSWAKGADASNESRSGWVERKTDPTPIADLPLAQVIPRCDELAQRQFQSFTEYDPFRGLVETAPQRAIAVLRYESRCSNYPRRYWSRLLSDWPKKATRHQTVLLAKALASLPASTVVEVRYELGHWITAHFGAIDHLDRALGHALFDHVVNALEQGGDEALKSGLGKTSVGGVEVPSNRMGVDYAINSPTGNLARGLIDAMFARKPKRGQQLAKDLRPRFERLLALPDEGGHNALTVIAEQLEGLYIIDPTWTKAVLLPRFTPILTDAEAAWSGFLASARMPSPKLFEELKGDFLAALAASSRWTTNGLHHLGQILVLALESRPEYARLFSFAEARGALRNTSPAVRQAALSFMRNRLNEVGGWEKLAVPFFRHAWPRERKFQTADTTRNLMFFLEGLGARFPEGVRLVLDFVVPSDDIDMFVYRFGREKENGRADLTKQFPHETMMLLNKVTDETRQRPPYGLADVLSRLAETAPELRHDERWQRLHRLTLAP